MANSVDSICFSRKSFSVTLIAQANVRLRCEVEKSTCSYGEMCTKCPVFVKTKIKCKLELRSKFQISEIELVNTAVLLHKRERYEGKTDTILSHST